MPALRLAKLPPNQQRLLQALLEADAHKKAAPDIQRPGAALEARRARDERPTAA
jgi:hypothetical protein